MTECAARGCPADTDGDGYCRMFGHLCAGPEPAPAATGDLDDLRPAAGSDPVIDTSRPTRPTGRLSTAAAGAGDATVTRWSGLVDMPAPPIRDPALAVLTDPTVPESKRYCSRCQLPVGRGRDGRAGRTEGFCPRDRTLFSFTPKLVAGDRVNQFEVVGCLAHGGVGWIYLARDLNLDGTWRVLKGLRDAGDDDAWEAVVAEGRFLAQVDHPNIVKIYDFVRHPDPVNVTVAGYLVMEYVGGRSLQQLLAEERAPDGAHRPLPLPRVLAYGAEMLSALGHLHDRGLLYCDMKPDNVIHGEDRLKLIDLGAVRRQDDTTSPVWGSSGYRAREVDTSGPSVSSDLYSVGRTLAVLSLGTRVLGADRLPEPADAPLLAAEESYHRLLRRATDPEPRRRFASAAQMREQLRGVLREVLSAADGRPRAEPSTLFGPQPRFFGTDDAGEMLTALDPRAVASALSVPLVDLDDPAASFLATVGYPDPDEVIAALKRSRMSTVEVTLRLVRAHIDRGDLGAAKTELTGLLPRYAGDWRVAWYQGVAALADGDPATARIAFDAVYSQLPGEIEAKLAYAATSELVGHEELAAALYERIWFTQRDYVSAAFGTARLRLTADWRNAVEVLESVPHWSSHYLAAQVAAVRARLLGPHPSELPASELVRAGEQIRRLPLDPERRSRARIDVLHGALRWVTVRRETADVSVLNCALTERDLRHGLSHAYRTLALFARPGSPDRIRLIDQANEVRPWTLL